MSRSKHGPLYTDRRRHVYGRATSLRGVPTPYSNVSRWLTGVVVVVCGCAWVWMLGGERWVDDWLQDERSKSHAAAVIPHAPVPKAPPKLAPKTMQQPPKTIAKVVAPAAAKNATTVVKAAGPTAAVVPRPAVPKPSPRPVAESLLRAGQDAVARRVIAVWGSVADVDSMRGAAVDLVDRGLALHDFKLREAIIRHRTRDARRYKRASKPRTVVAWRRVLDWRSLRAFLDAFAKSLPTDPNHADPAVWMPGDIVYVKPSPRRARLMPAIVSDRTDDDGVSLLITLDPRDKVALEIHSLDDYPIRAHFRLTDALLKKARSRLGM